MHVLLCNAGCWLVHSNKYIKYIFWLILKLDVMYGAIILHVEPISTLLNVFLHKNTYCYVKSCPMNTVEIQIPFPVFVQMSSPGILNKLKLKLILFEQNTNTIYIKSRIF